MELSMSITTIFEYQHKNSNNSELKIKPQNKNGKKLSNFESKMRNIKKDRIFRTSNQNWETWKKINSSNFESKMGQIHKNLKLCELNV